MDIICTQSVDCIQFLDGDKNLVCRPSCPGPLPRWHSRRRASCFAIRRAEPSMAALGTSSE
jgi:hypothetical protein